MKHLIKKTMTAFALSLMLFSCSKKEGCTDKNATNYDSSAESDCNCCNYEGQVVFWYGQSAANFLVDNDVTALTFYVDGSLVGSQASNVYWTGSPNCGQSQSITVNKKLGSSKSKSYEFQVKDQDSEIVWSGTVNFEANTCVKQELTE